MKTFRQFLNLLSYKLNKSGYMVFPQKPMGTALTLFETIDSLKINNLFLPVSPMAHEVIGGYEVRSPHPI